MDIKIFVSHRVDLNAETIDNSIFVPIKSGLALASAVEKIKMTQQEMDANFITDESEAYFNRVVLDVSAFNHLPNQLWNLADDSQLNINIEAGSNWFDVTASSVS